MSRQKRARREAVVGAAVGAVLGAGVWSWAGGSLVLWVVPLALAFALIFHQNEWLDG